MVKECDVNEPCLGDGDNRDGVRGKGGSNVLTLRGIQSNEVQRQRSWLDIQINRQVYLFIVSWGCIISDTPGLLL